MGATVGCDGYRKTPSVPSSLSTLFCRFSFICTMNSEGLEAFTFSIRARPEGGYSGNKKKTAKEGFRLTYGGHGVVRSSRHPFQELPHRPDGASWFPHQLVEGCGRLKRMNVILTMCNITRARAACNVQRFKTCCSLFSLAVKHYFSLYAA